ncbi:MAG: oligosaccharide flippase family protein [Anaerolineaceae bacterium]|nr:oligosaccharide flippase family protein [Anaerolineaceae bacterium]
MQDRLLRRVLRNSSYLFISNVISTIMVIMTTRLLGVSAFGELGVITVFVSNVNRLLSFRMADVVVRYMGEYIARKEYDRAAALVKAAGLIEAVTSLAAYAVLALLAPLGARLFIKDVTATSLILIYGFSIIGNITNETATGVLQVTNHYRSQALINLVQTFLVAGVIGYAYFAKAGLMTVLVAYLLGKMVLGLGPVGVALYHLNKLLGKDWWRASFDLLPPRRELMRFGITTNLSGTLNLVVRDSEELWIGYFLSTMQVGYFKAAKALIQMVVMPITPFVNTTYPELNRAIVTRQWEKLRSLLRRISLVAAAWTGAVGIGLILVGRQVIFQPWVIFGWPVILFDKAFSPLKATFLPAFPVLMVLLIGYGVANILFWNRSLLLALGQPGYALRVTLWTTVAKVTGTLIFVPLAGANGYIVEAWLLSGYFVLSVGLMVWRGLNEVARVGALGTAQGVAD